VTAALATTQFLIPEARALAMVDACARQLAEVSTIPDVLKVVTQAEAIQAVMSKIKASRDAQKAALRLRVEAEAQLGRITAQIPQGARGGAAAKNPGQRTKRQVLTESGIHHYRAGVAERLARTPAEKVEEAIANAKSPGMYGVLSDLGLRKPWREYTTPEVTSRHLDFLADEAISLLERSVKTQSSPHAGTVAEMRNRLLRLRVKT
jgi:hypothetical protein